MKKMRQRRGAFASVSSLHALFFRILYLFTVWLRKHHFETSLDSDSVLRVRFPRMSGPSCDQPSFGRTTRRKPVVSARVSPPQSQPLRQRTQRHSPWARARARARARAWALARTRAAWPCMKRVGKKQCWHAAGFLQTRRAVSATHASSAHTGSTVLDTSAVGVFDVLYISRRRRPSTLAAYRWTP